MKKGLLIAFTKNDKFIISFSILLLCFILNVNLYSQRPQTILIETWTTGSWHNSSRETFTYDGSGHLLSALSQTWDVPSVTWENSFQSTYTNNPDGTANQVITQLWDGVSAWNNSTRTTYTYNASKKILTSVTEMWFVAIWQNLLMQTNTYDVSGYLTNNLFQSWDLISTTWKNSSQTNYTNNLNGTVNQEITQTWDGISAWNNSQRSIFTYNGSNKVLTDVSDNWTTGSWQPYSKETDTYDGSGYLTNTLSQLWDAGSTTWKNSSQSNYTNNIDGTLSQDITQLWDGVSAWNNSERLTFTYSSPTWIPELFNEGSIIIYPNPAGDVISIKGNNSIYGSTYSITDQAGKQVLKGRLLNDYNTIDISSLTNGIYFLHIGERSQHSYKVIKNQSR